MLKGELVQRLADCEISTRLQEVKKNVLDQQKSELMKENHNQFMILSTGSTPPPIYVTLKKSAVATSIIQLLLVSLNAAACIWSLLLIVLCYYLN